MTQTTSQPVHFKKRVVSTGLVRANNDRPTGIKSCDLQRLIDGWLLDSEYRRLSERTIKNRRGIMDRFSWWVKSSQLDCLDTAAMRQYIAYVGCKGGMRWGNDVPGKVRDVSEKPTCATTVEAYYVNLAAFFN